MTEAMVTPGLLTWARNRRGLGVSALASKLNVKPEAIEDWEQGERKPTFRQAQRFAEALYVPFGYLYLQDPPLEALPLADYRTIPGQAALEPSPDLLDLLNDVLGKQRWFREYRESEGVEELPFVGRFTAGDPAEAIAADIRDVIDVEGARERSSNWEGFMRELTRNAERSGIMIMRSGVVANNTHRPLDVDEFRGFSVSDEVAPLVFINARDFRGAQIFTLIHEMAHVWAGAGGVSNPDYGLRHETADNSIEQFCNRVAAETLVPGDDFKSRWAAGSANIQSELRELSRYYRVSSMVILRQAKDHDFLSVSTYREHYDLLVDQASQAAPASESGGNFRYTLTARNGTAFTEAVISSAAEGTLFSSEAADMLGVKIKTLPGIAQHLFGSPLTLA